MLKTKFQIYWIRSTKTTVIVNSMMTSSNGNIFRVAGPLCGEFTGHRWIPLTMPVTRSFDAFFDLRLNKRQSKQSKRRWFKTPSRHCNVIKFSMIPHSHHCITGPLWMESPSQWAMNAVHSCFLWCFLVKAFNQTVEVPMILEAMALGRHRKDQAHPVKICNDFYKSITVTSWWARWRLKSSASRLFTPPFIQAQTKENIKYLRHWPLWGKFTAQRASNAENVSIWFRHHEVTEKTKCRRWCT